MVVYLDLIFLVNFLMDGAMLFTTAKIRKIQIVWWRLLLASVIGASYVVLMFVPELSMLYTFLVKIGFSLVMTAVAFRIGNVRQFIRHLAVFYVVNFAAAGGIFGARYLLAEAGQVMNGILYTQSGGAMEIAQFGIAFVVVATCVSILLIRSVFASQRMQDRTLTFTAEVEVKVGEYTSRCTGLIDTGNQLYEPLTRTPVMVMEAGQWEGKLPADWIAKIRSGHSEDLLLAENAEIASGDWLERLRLVPYRGVNRSTQLMVALKPDLVIVTRDGSRTETVRTLVGLDGGVLSRDGTYHAIIHPALLD